LPVIDGIVTYLSLGVDHLEEALVVLVLVLVHAGLTGAHFLICDLTVEEIGVLGVDILDLPLEALLLSLEEFLVLFPHDGLLVVEGFLLGLTVLLLSHLSVEVRTGLELASFGQFNLFLIFEAETEFTFLFVFVDLLVLSGLARVLLSNDGRGHSVHEVLGAFLALREFVLTVSLLLVEHTGVFLLSRNIFLTLLFFLSELLRLLFFVLFEHLLQVHLLLLSLVVEHLTLSIHLLLQPVDKLELLVVILLVLDTSSLLLKLELTVAAFLFNLNFRLVFTLLLHLFLAEELKVFTLHSVIFGSLGLFHTLRLVLLNHLVVEFFLNESLAFLFALKSLLLLFVVQKGVEFLDSEPLIFFINFGVDIGLSGLNSASRDLRNVVACTD